MSLDPEKLCECCGEFSHKLDDENICPYCLDLKREVEEAEVQMTPAQKEVYFNSSNPLWDNAPDEIVQLLKKRDALIDFYNNKSKGLKK